MIQTGKSDRQKKNRVAQEMPTVRFLYKTTAGRCLLKLLMKTHFDRLMVRFLQSGLSRIIVPVYIRLNHVDLEDCEKKSFTSFRDFFMRKRKQTVVEGDDLALISLCDGYLSAYKVRENARFRIKGMDYTVEELAPGLENSERFQNGACLIFRLCASDYHRYMYFDDCVQGEHHYVEGELNSVQNCACETYPVYIRNRRTWSVLKTKHFGDVLETEVGAFVVGGIVNRMTPQDTALCSNGNVKRGMQKGHFDLAGSTIVLLFERDKIVLDERLREGLSSGGEVRVRMGEKIGCVKKIDRT